MKIGVFDSGFGGLNVFRYVSDELKSYDLVYLGDTARTPYGNRSQETVYEYTRQGVKALFDIGCSLVILACNTASSEALRRIQQEYIPVEYPGNNVLGVLIPVAEELVKVTKNKRVGILATESTITSNAYEREIYKIDPEIKVFGQSAPLLVPIVESEEKDERIIYSALENYLTPLVEEEVDTIVLGCTHYGILKKEILETLKRLGSSAKVISGEKEIARKLKIYLERHSEIDDFLTKEGLIEFYTTDLGQKFDSFGSKIFGREIKSIRISL